jgi:hypothetical protein
MLGSSLNRRVIHTAVLWAMIPLAVLNGRMVTGCISPDGQFNPNCNCCTVRSAATKSLEQGAKQSCRCCATSHCSHSSCCKGKSVAHSKLPTKHGNGFNSSSCQSVAQYLIIPTIIQNVVDHDDLVYMALDVVTADFTPFLAGIPQREPGIDATPPPDNLVISLQRFLI